MDKLKVKDLDYTQAKTLEALKSIFKTIPGHKIEETFCKGIEEGRRLFPHWAD